MTRTNPPPAETQRVQLESFLEFHRQTLLGKCAGLTEAQLKRRSVQASALSLLGLVRHMSEVERGWFRRRVAGEDIGYIYARDDNPDADFNEVDAADPAACFDIYAAEVDSARAAAAGRPLDGVFFHPRRRVDISLRWVYLHMIEEYARHNGHADLIRESIDGATGE